MKYPLREVDAIPPEKLQRLVVAHEFSDGALAEAAGNGDHRLHEMLVHGVARRVADEAAVDLEVIDRQMLEVEKDEKPTPKSSSANPQPSAFNVRTNFWAWSMFAIAPSR